MSKLAPQLPNLSDESAVILLEKIENNQQIDNDFLHRALSGPQTTLRAHSARILGNQGGESSIPFLIDALSDDSIHVGALYELPGMHTTRYWANESLKQLTGQDFKFAWDDSKKQREKAINRWRRWYLKKLKPAAN